MDCRKHPSPGFSPMGSSPPPNQEPNQSQNEAVPRTPASASSEQLASSTREDRG
jgi:hypothetical protein